LHPRPGLFATIQSIDILVCQLLHRCCVVPNPAEKNSSSKNFPSGSTQFQDLRNVLANSDQKYTRASMKFVALD